MNWNVDPFHASEARKPKLRPLVLQWHGSIDVRYLSKFMKMDGFANPQWGLPTLSLSECYTPSLATHVSSATLMGCLGRCILYSHEPSYSYLRMIPDGFHAWRFTRWSPFLHHEGFSGRPLRHKKVTAYERLPDRSAPACSMKPSFEGLKIWDIHIPGLLQAGMLELQVEGIHASQVLVCTLNLF